MSGITLLVLFFLRPIMSVVSNYIPYFKVYLNSSTYGIGEPQIATVIGILIRIVVLIFAAYFFNKSKANYSSDLNERISYYINMVIVSLLIMIASLGFNLLDRCNYFYWLFALVLIPEIIDRASLESNKRIITISTYSVGILFFIIVNVFRPEWNHIIPYESILF